MAIEILYQIKKRENDSESNGEEVMMKPREREDKEYIMFKFIFPKKVSLKAMEMEEGK